LTYNLKIQ